MLKKIMTANNNNETASQQINIKQKRLSKAAEWVRKNGRTLQILDMRAVMR